MAIDRDGDGPPLRKDKDDPRPAKAGNELRASPFTEDVFDDEYYGRRARGGGPSFTVIAGVVFFAAIVAAAGWYVLAERSEISTADSGGNAGGEIIRADKAPYKVKPEEPGGMKVDNQDKMVYDRVAKAAAPNRVENLLPAPEEPRKPPEAKPKPDPKKAEPPKVVAKAEPKPEAKPESVKSEPAAVAAEDEDPMAKLVAEVQGLRRPPPDQQPEPLVNEPDPASAPAPAPAAPAATSPKLLVPAAPDTPAPTTVASGAPAPAPESAAPVAAAPVGAVFIQLASARSEEGAMSEWKRISGKNPDLLGGLSPSVAQAEVPDKGTFFRLRAGPVADRTAAQELCAGLIQRGLTCLIVKP